MQGVFFRQETARRATTRGLSGWVRNRSDGVVEAVFEGEHEAIDSMIRWCGEGPPLADVTEVEVSWEEAEGDTGFSIR